MNSPAPLHSPLFPWVLFLIAVSFTLAAMSLSDHWVRQGAAERFRVQATAIEHRFGHHLAEYDRTLHIFAQFVGPDAGRAAWAAAIEGLEFNDYTPGLRALGHAAPEGGKGAGQRARVGLVLALGTGGADLPAEGADLASSPILKETLERARDTGAPAMSRPLGWDEPDTGGGFFIIHPLYAGPTPATLEGRREALSGFVFGIACLRELMTTVAVDLTPGVDVEVFDGDQLQPDALLFHSVAGEPAHLTGSGIFPLGHRVAFKRHGRTFTLFVHAQPDFLSPAERGQTWLVGGGGLLLDLLLLVLARLHLSRHREAQRLATAMTGEIRLQEGRYRSLVEDMPALICRFDRDGRLTFVNRYYAEYFGQPPEALIGLSFFQFIPETEHAATRAHLQRLDATHPSTTCEHRVVAADGEVRWQRWTDRALVGAAGDGSDANEVTEYQSIGEDITEFRRSTEALGEAERFTRAALDSLSAHIAILDREGVILTVNRAWRRFAEANGGALHAVGEGANYLRACDEAAGDEAAGDEAVGEDAETARRCAAGIRRLLAGEQAEFHLEYPCHSPDEQRWFVVRITPFVGEGPVRVVVAHETITERRQAEERLIQSESRLREAQALARLGHWELELRDDGLSWSDEVFRIFEVDSTRFATTYNGFLERIHPDDRELVDRAYADAVRDHRPYELTHRLLMPDGRIKYVHERCITHYGAEGRPLRSVGTVQDVTEQRLGEIERLGLERQLYQSQKLEALGRLTSGIAHDFNNILAAILGYANLARERYAVEGQGKLGQYLQQVITAGERARDLVAKMLAYGRMQSSATAEPMYPAVVVREVASLLASTMPAGIRVRTEVVDEAAAIRIDPGDLHQALMNLVLNARDALGARGEIRLRLSRVHEEAQVCPHCHETYRGDFAEIRVEDDGPGIPADVLPRIFDPFFTTKGVGEGSGLGLPVVQGIARRWGGHIQVCRDVERGAAFRLLLPLADRPVALPIKPAAPAAPDTQPSAGGSRVWVVDDEPMIADYLGDLLEQHGYRVTTFTDPITVVEHLVADPGAVDLLLSDQSMPDMGGLDLTEALREYRPDLPVVLCSGLTDAVDRRRAAALGVHRVLTKPVDQAVLLTALAEARAAPPGVANAGHD